ncbi:MAG: hypothetical protein AABX82_07755, partial [Nanoarchaeota archaeon]
MTKKEFFLFFFYLLIVALMTKPFTYGHNEGSRFNTIRGIVEAHSLAWETEIIYTTEDRVLINGKLYSDKPPVFALLAAIPYYFLYKTGFTFVAQAAFAPYFMKLLVVAIPTGIFLIFFYRTLQKKTEEKYAFFLTICLGFGTLLFTYSTAFNNHNLTAFTLFAAFVLYMRAASGEKINYFLFGFLLGSTIALDIITGALFTVFFGIYLFFVRKIPYHHKLFLVLGCAIPVALHLVLNFMIFGDLLPAYAHPQYYIDAQTWQNESNLPGFYNHASLWALFVYTFHSTLGFRGLFSYTPILLFGLWFLYRKAVTKYFNFDKESMFLSVLAGVIGVIAYYCFYTINYGGASYGSRYLLPLTPILLYFCIDVFKEDVSQKWRYAFYFCAALSFVIAFTGSFNPWTNIGEGLHAIPFFTNLSVTALYNTAGHYV